VSHASDEVLMREAITLARKAAAAGEVPVGCVVELGGKVIGQGENRTIRDSDPTAHAEIIALREAAGAFGDYRLEGAKLVCTVEPCLMCLGAILHARIAEVVYGVAEPKFGALESRFQLGGHERLRKTTFRGGVLAEEIAPLMSAFFATLRGGEANSQ
jgi:tRNA(adenine34) deaminase